MTADHIFILAGFSTQRLNCKAVLGFVEWMEGYSDNQLVIHSAVFPDRNGNCWRCMEKENVTCCAFRDRFGYVFFYRMFLPDEEIRSNSCPSHSWPFPTIHHIFDVSSVEECFLMIVLMCF